jgi:hypothetical protein
VNHIHDLSHQYNYENIGHGCWVQKLVNHHIWCQLVMGMCWQRNSTKNAYKGAWKSGGASGLVAICHTTQEEQIDPEQLVGLLSELDEGCS